MYATITLQNGETIERGPIARPAAFSEMIEHDGIRLELTAWSPISKSVKREHYARFTDGYTYAMPDPERGASHSSATPKRVIDHGADAGQMDRSMFDRPTSATQPPAPDARPLSKVAAHPADVGAPAAVANGAGIYNGDEYIRRQRETQRERRTKTATVHRAAGGGHFLAWTRDERETVTDAQAESIATALDPFDMQGADDHTRQHVAREILDAAEYRGLLIYREWVEAAEIPPARETLADAQLFKCNAAEVIYRDAGAGVYLQWSAADPYMVRVLSADRQRVLGYFAGASGTAGKAHRDLCRHINTAGKPYGAWTAPDALWQAGDPE